MSDKLADQINTVENSLKKVMGKYDIKHPLRGPEYDGYPCLKQEFKDLIAQTTRDLNPTTDKTLVIIDKNCPGNHFHKFASLIK